MGFEIDSESILYNKELIQIGFFIVKNRFYRDGHKKCVLVGCMNWPPWPEAESRCLGQTFLANSVCHVSLEKIENKNRLTIPTSQIRHSTSPSIPPFEPQRQAEFYRKNLQFIFISPPVRKGEEKRERERERDRKKGRKERMGILMCGSCEPHPNMGGKKPFLC